MTRWTGGMDDHDEGDRHRQQIERLLGCRGVGALGADAIAVNLALPPGSLDALLNELVRDGRSVRLRDGCFALSPAGRT